MMSCTCCCSGLRQTIATVSHGAVAEPKDWSQSLSFAKELIGPMNSTVALLAVSHFGAWQDLVAFL